ncbi:MAG: UDP-3-O-(3-hydroxymyristoyl)glucosamine N-acyltransferase [Thermodesulfovibrionales bacterium]|nr:UDP-3-O-(3-hydroxymyristoyl)glucosamine N-acyltransferase [Thermodesulfovibrionales bacterium]
MKLREIAEFINGKLIGDGDIDIVGAANISDAKEGYISFIIDKKWLSSLAKNKPSALILKEEIKGIDVPQIIVRNPLYGFAKLLSVFYKVPHPKREISKYAYVSEKAVIGEDVSIQPNVFISDNVKIGSGTIIYHNVFVGYGVEIGDNCLIYPNVVINYNVKIGNNVIIQAGAVIGSDGFGYVQEGGIHYKIPQVGTVIIEDNVEIGANTTIDRATLGATVIKGGTKIDNLVQIGHNVKVGSNVILVSQTGIGGSSEIGDGAVLGGQVGIADHVIVEAGTMIAAKAGVMGKLSRGIYCGAPAIPHKEWWKAIAVFNKLPELKRRVDELEKKLKDLQQQINNRT